MDTFPSRAGPDHIGILSDRVDDHGLPLVINNWTDGTVTAEMDLLTFVPGDVPVPPAAVGSANFAWSMRSATCVIGVALCVLAARPGVARADDAAPSSYRAVIDRVDLEPAAIGGLRLRVKLSALALQGQLLDLNDRQGDQAR